MRVLDCLSTEHDLWMVLLAMLVCAGSGWVALELFRRARERHGRQRTGWVLLAGLAAGCAMWCAHFFAMLAYRNDIPAEFDALLTATSLLVAISGSTLSMALALREGVYAAPRVWITAGLLFGITLATMHYIGMFAYRVPGLLIWDLNYVAASVVLSLVFAIAVLWCERLHLSIAAIVVFVIWVFSLHLTGMAAVSVIPMMSDGGATDGSADLAVAVACAMLLVVAAGAVSRMIDSDANEQTVDDLRRIAMTDGLTGLPNRHSFTQVLERDLAEAQAAGRSIAVVMVDFDKFKAVNDVHGHEGGDRLLRIAAVRMSAGLRDGEMLARVGGDELAAICPLWNRSSMDDFLARLQAALAQPIRIAGFDVVPQASFGVSVYPKDGDTAAQILGNADLAMYRAKADPVHGVSFYEASMDETARTRRKLVLDMRRALERDEFELHYQVQVDLDDRDDAHPTMVGAPSGGTRVFGYEALLRWRHPTRGYVSPAEFIPLAEESGLILTLGAWVLRTAAREAVSWSEPYRIAVNISSMQITHGDLPALVRDVLAETGLEPARLELEITENLVIEDPDKCRAAMNVIGGMGVSFALDDFGTGYSSLSMLRTFRFNRLKLDRSFLADVVSSPEARAVLQAVMSLARSLGMQILAEGVETPGQLRLLHDEGCQQGQGYLFGRPQPHILPPPPTDGGVFELRTA